MKNNLFLLLLILFPWYSLADATSVSAPVDSRVRVIIDNDFGGDPDGLFQLAHHLLSPSVSVQGVIASGHYAEGFYDQPGSVAFSVEQAREILSVMQLKDSVQVFGGVPVVAGNETNEINVEAARFIVQEAMREDIKTPLFYAAGAGLTTLAQAYRLEPKIADRLTLIWIGGPEHEGIAFLPPSNNQVEYNLGIDLKAAQQIFNESTIPIWQVPRDAYRQALVSHAELKHRLDKGRLGRYLTGKIESLMIKAGRQLGEAYALGDNPLVLLSALHSSWDADPSSSRYVQITTPRINEKGSYVKQRKGRSMRVYTQLDARLMFEDFYAKVAIFDGH